MKLQVLLPLVALVFAGCTGYGPNEIAPGDAVSGSAIIYAPNGTVLVPEFAFGGVVGNMQMGLGLAFERGLLGAEVGDKLTIKVDNDRSLDATSEVRSQRVIARESIFTELPRNQFVAGFGTPVVGNIISPDTSFYSYEVTSENATVVVLRAMPDTETLEPLQVIGSLLEINILGENEMEFVLHSDPGAMFTIMPPANPNQGTPLNLPPGAYTSVSHTDTELVFERNANYRAGGLPDAFEIRVSIGFVSKANIADEPVDGNYGAVNSYFLNQPFESE